ncbi:hypothetical protein DL766_002010 [Monosporascus sp. MC13-8B]|uniref:COMPASS complex Set1 subunit N-SET domain-containing protein n=1 Tax=Monosporascus cannonballus TaxID=155416 RepID=A0ABY0HH48_9PEZI|nr:hypothetical protein DL762_002305 [Monosporascus cannonballus]RYO94967.1 hypothetical protein DL763_003863 [Monosporascus cannonballus]RYP36348.1 hypothetical protein DL766_002010 [Monosporascus sp. MC13-8B]
MADDTPKSTTPIPVPVPVGSSTGEAAAAADATASSAAGNPSGGGVVETAEKDVAMADAPGSGNEQAPSPAPVATTATNAPSPAPPARTGTPRIGPEGNTSSRAASQHPDQGFTMPAEAPPHGAPVRQYLNSKVTGTLLEGMKAIAKEQPKDPLRVLGEFLIQRSKELETQT